MIDTLKLLIPLSPSQHRRVRQIAAHSDRWNWVLHHQKTGELLFRKVSGLFKTDSHSYHREIRWDVDAGEKEENVHLTIELSLPKYWYGHNVSLLYDWQKALRHLREELNRQFGLKTRWVLPPIEEWKLARVDLCYAWWFPCQDLAQRFLDSLKVLHFPRKQPTVRPESIMFVGATYSLKFYLKYPEFLAHDRRELLKQQAALEWVEYLENLASGVLRMEVTLRHRYLKRNGLNTVADLAGFHQWVEFENPPTDQESALAQVMVASMVHLNGLGIDMEASDWLEKGGHPVTEGLTLKAPAGTLEWCGKEYSIPENSMTFHRVELTVWTLQRMLRKFVGDSVEMRTEDMVYQVLSEHYKPVKTARLTSFWLYVRRFGSEKARSDFGKRSYYYNRAEMKKAGVGLLEPPDMNKVIPLHRAFMEEFRLVVPSCHVVNRVDDDRNSQNLLNFRPKAN